MPRQLECKCGPCTLEEWREPTRHTYPCTCEPTLPGVDQYAEELHKAMFIEPPNFEEQ